MSATRLLALAPASVQSQAEALKPLLELFFSNLGQGKEPLELAESQLPEELITALAALPLVLDKKPDEPLKLWTAKGFKQQQRVLAQLVDLLKSHNGLLVTGGAGSGKTSLVRKLLGEINQPTALMAPTGKAAARLREAMAPMPEGMQCGTIHRWLEASGDGAVQAVADYNRETMNTNFARETVRFLEQWLAIAVGQLAHIQPHSVVHHQGTRWILAIGNVDAVNQVENFG